MKVAHLGRTKNPTRRTVAKNRLNIDLCCSPDVLCLAQCAMSCNEGFWNRQTTWRIEANVDAFHSHFKRQETRMPERRTKNASCRLLSSGPKKVWRKKSVTQSRFWVTHLKKTWRFWEQKSRCVFSENPRPSTIHVYTVCCTIARVWHIFC